MAEGLARLQQLSLIQQQQGQYTMLPLTRGYVLSELSTHPEFEHNARNRWVDWYLSLARSHGGKDWTEWNDYQPLEREWENIIEVMEWCISSDAESGSLHDRYPNACQLWRDVKCYTYSQGYRQSRLTHWETSLVWLDWLIEAAQTRKDWATAAEMMGDRAWKLTLMGQSHHLAAAGTLFTQAWELRHYQTVKEQVELAIHTAAWHIQQQDFESAKQWLDRAKALLDNAQLDPSLAARYSLNILYYQGEISYKTGDYEESQTLFQQIVDKAQAIGWQRATFLAKDFLADIAIKQGNLDQAQQFLTEGLRVAQENGDRCSGAYAKRSLAQLERKRGRLSIAHRWATEARKEFESLGMLPEAQETQVLLQG
jgi:LuxR family glucitol operon transcriptional activator